MPKAPPDPCLKEEICLHGVFLALAIPSLAGRSTTSTPTKACPTSVGVLITGEAGIGKSELALELINRGHALVADDAPIFRPTADGRWQGHCPSPIQDLLEVRGLGILDIRHLFGAQAVCAAHGLDLIIRLERQASPSCPEERLHGAWRDHRLGHASIPELILTVDGARNLALLVEVAARLYTYGGKVGIGYNAAAKLAQRLVANLGKESS